MRKLFILLLTACSLLQAQGYGGHLEGFNGGGGNPQTPTLKKMTSLYSLSFPKISQKTSAYVPDDDIFSFVNGADELPFSVGYWVLVEDGTQGLGVIKGLWSTSDTSKHSSEWETYIHPNNKTFIAYTQSSNYNNGKYIYNQAPTPMVEYYKNKWLFVVFVNDGLSTNQSWSIYLNGKKMIFAQTSKTTGYTSMANDTGNLYIGFMGKYDSLNYSSGCMDNIGIWNAALTDDEIAALYNGGQGIDYNITYDSYKPSNLVAWWDFEEGSGNPVDKVSGKVMYLNGAVFCAKTPVSVGNSESLLFKGGTGTESSWMKFSNTIARDSGYAWSISWHQYLYYGRSAVQALFVDTSYNASSTSWFRMFWGTTDTVNNTAIFYFVSKKNTAYTWTSVPLTYRAWQKIVLTCDGTDTLELFVDNVSMGKKYVPNNTAISINGFGYLEPASYNSNYTPKGYFDEMKIYNEEINSAERVANTIPTSQYTSNLLFYFNCNLEENAGIGRAERDIQRMYPTQHQESLIIYKGSNETGSAMYFSDPVFVKNVPFKY